MKKYYQQHEIQLAFERYMEDAPVPIKTGWHFREFIGTHRCSETPLRLLPHTSWNYQHVYSFEGNYGERMNALTSPYYKALMRIHWLSKDQ